MSRPLLVLRPEPGNAATVRRARSLGLEADGVPIFAVGPVAWVAPDPAGFVGVLLTSANALRMAGPDLARFIHLPAFAVGSATAELAREAGFTSVVVGESDVSRMMGRIATLGVQRLLHICGADITPYDLFGIEVERVVVYDSPAVEPAPDLGPLLALEPVVLLHSPRAARHFASLADEASRPGISLVAISQRAAEAAGNGWREVAIAAEPRDEALLKVAATLCRRENSGSD